MTIQDLSHAFGPPATASLRGLLPHREGGEHRPEPGPPTPLPVPRAPEDDRTDDRPEDDRPEDDRTDDGYGDAGGSPTGAAREERPTSRPRRTETPSTPPLRRRSIAHVGCRDHVDLLVLLALRQGPSDGRGVIRRVRESSEGHLEAPETTVHVTLHRLTRNRLLGREPDPRSGRRFYVLTEAGERAIRARLREWQALARGVDAVARRGGAV